MAGTALLIAAGLLVVFICIRGLATSRRRRVERMAIAPDAAARAQAGRQISREINEQDASHLRSVAFTGFMPELPPSLRRRGGPTGD
jgi:hypothetical protein